MNPVNVAAGFVFGLLVGRAILAAADYIHDWKDRR